MEDTEKELMTDRLTYRAVNVQEDRKCPHQFYDSRKTENIQ